MNGSAAVIVGRVAHIEAGDEGSVGASVESVSVDHHELVAHGASAHVKVFGAVVLHVKVACLDENGGTARAGGIHKGGELNSNGVARGNLHALTGKPIETPVIARIVTRDGTSHFRRRLSHERSDIAVFLSIPRRVIKVEIVA